MPDEKKPETKAPEAPAPPPAKKSLPLVLIAVLMVVEGIGVFFLAKMFSSSPESSMASEAGDEHADNPKSGEHGEDSTDALTAWSEIAMSDSKTFNKESGRMILLHIKVSGLVAGSDLEKAKKLVEAHQARLDDRINTVIRSSEPKYLNEAGLETIKRRIKHECDRIFENDSMVQEILIPYMVQSGSGV